MKNRSNTATPSGFDEQTVFRSLFSASPDGLLLVDSAGRVVLANPAAATLLGYSTDELAGLAVDDLVPTHVRDRHAAYRKGYAAHPVQRPMGSQMELTARKRDGSEVMVEIALSPLRDLGLPYVVVALRGVAEYPRVKQALQRARYSESIARMGRLAVDTLDPHLLLSQIPAVAAEALQADVALVLLLEPNQPDFRVAAGVGLLPHEAVGQRVPNRLDTPCGFALAHGAPLIVSDFQQERRFHVPASYLDSGLTSAMAVPLSDRGRPIGLLAVRSKQPQRFGPDEVNFLESLSNLLAATLQRVQTEETLNHAQRMESVGQLTGGIAHDFNNLLTIIQGNLQVLEESPAVSGDAFAAQLVAAATRASKRGADLTSKLLAFSRRQVLSPRRVDVGALLDSLADMLRRTLDQRIQISVTAAPHCPPCLVDAAQLDSALLNIAINARDAMPEGGHLSFSIQHEHALPLTLHGDFGLDGAAADAYLAIAISDTGAGMPAAVKERAFEPFFTTKEVGRGTGLGLSTVYGFAQQSKGAVTLTSAPGEGTTVTLYLPVYAENSIASAHHDAGHPKTLPTQPHPVPQGLRVLLVEDEAEVRKVVLGFLTHLGCEVTTCINAEQALQKLSSSQAPDLLLTDVALGTGKRGTELAREALAQHPNMRVLLTSGYSSDLFHTPGGGPLPWELLRKPFDRSELASALARVMA